MPQLAEADDERARIPVFDRCRIVERPHDVDGDFRRKAPDLLGDRLEVAAILSARMGHQDQVFPLRAGGARDVACRGTLNRHAASLAIAVATASAVVSFTPSFRSEAL